MFLKSKYFVIAFLSSVKNTIFPIFFLLGSYCEFKFRLPTGYRIDPSYGFDAPTTMAVGDFNNDNQSDVIFTYANTESIGILIGNDDEFFITSIIYSTRENNGPQLVVVHDFNHDNHLDFVVAYRLSDNIDIFLGTGNGTFQEQITFSVGHNLTSITTGDFNHDDQSDMAVLNSTNIAVLLGNGDGTFQIHWTISTNECSNLLVGDFNNDRVLDLAASSYSQQDLRVFFGNSDGTFTRKITTLTDQNSRPYLMATSDFNHDGQSDLAIIDWETNNIAIRLGNANGTFQTQTTYSTGRYSQPRSIAIGDFNNDNQSDIAVANYHTYNVGLFLGLGDGTFREQMIFHVIYGNHPKLIQVGDFNGDGKLDVGVIIEYSIDLVFLLNSCDCCESHFVLGN